MFSTERGSCVHLSEMEKDQIIKVTGNHVEQDCQKQDTRKAGVIDYDLCVSRFGLTFSTYFLTWKT